MVKDVPDAFDVELEWSDLLLDVADDVVVVI